MKNKNKRNTLAIAAYLNRPSAGIMQTGKKDNKKERKEGKRISRNTQQGRFDFVTKVLIID